MWPSQLFRQFRKLKVQVETLGPNYGKRYGISTFLQRFAFLHGGHVWMRCLQCWILGLGGSAQKPSVPYVINALKILRMPSLIAIRLGPFGVCGRADLPFLKTDKQTLWMWRSMLLAMALFRILRLFLSLLGTYGSIETRLSLNPHPSSLARFGILNWDLQRISKVP